MNWNTSWNNTYEDKSRMLPATRPNSYANKTPFSNWDSMAQKTPTVAAPATAVNQINTNGLMTGVQAGVLNPEKEGIFGNLFASKDTFGNGYSGWGAPSLNLATGLANAYTGWQNMETEKDKLAAQENMWNNQFKAQRTSYNNELSSQYKGRYSTENPLSSKENYDAYMKAHGI